MSTKSFLIIGGLSIIGGLALILTNDAFRHKATLPVPANLVNYDGCERCSQAGMALAWSIDHNPTAWNADHYTISNNDKNISVWIVNGPEYVRVGDNYLGDGWKPEDYDRSLLWRAFQRWQQWKIRRDLQQSTAETTLDKS